MIINGVLVVEGKQDKTKLSTFLTSEIITVNGLEVNKEAIEYLKERSKTTTIYILTDDDDAGKIIREKIKKEINNCIDIYVDKKMSNPSKKKKGVAEIDINHLKELLKTYEVIIKDNDDVITLEKLSSLGLLDKKSLIIEKYHLGHVSTKEMIKRLNYLGINFDELKKLHQ